MATATGGLNPRNKRNWSFRSAESRSGSPEAAEPWWRTPLLIAFFVLMAAGGAAFQYRAAGARGETKRRPSMTCRERQPLCERDDQYLAAKLLKWGVVKIVASKEQADCVASFGREAERIAEPFRKGADARADAVSGPEKTDKLSVYFNGFVYSTSASVEIVHRESSFLVWSASKTLARRLVKQFKSDY